MNVGVYEENLLIVTVLNGNQIGNVILKKLKYFKETEIKENSHIPFTIKDKNAIFFLEARRHIAFNFTKLLIT